MKSSLIWIFCSLSFLAAFPKVARAWGRHDLITRLSVDSPLLSRLRSVEVVPEPIEKAAPDLLKRVIPDVERWCVRYHKEHDDRYSWSVPKLETLTKFLAKNGRKLSPREELLWDLEDNIDTPLQTGPERNAADILIRYAEEPDGKMDSGLDQSPYIERVRESMSYFYEPNNPHTHTFRHYYVPSSLIPPIWSPKGIAPYRSGLYAQLAIGAFRTGHPYWGYRFLAWSIHYMQDVTQPWHTVFVPSFSLLSFSRAKMKHDISALHFLTEAFTDGWLLQVTKTSQGDIDLAKLEGHTSADSHKASSVVLVKLSKGDQQNPWFVPELAEGLARKAHADASDVADQGKAFFWPIVEKLGPNLHPDTPVISLGGLRLSSYGLDFTGNGTGATEFLSPIWKADFGKAKERDELLHSLQKEIGRAIQGSRQLVDYVLTQAGAGISPQRARKSLSF